MKKRLTKLQIMGVLGFTKQVELADYFQISEQAVSQWPDEEPIPELRELQARQRDQSKFDEAA
jgi:hypothetical protein